MKRCFLVGSPERLHFWHTQGYLYLGQLLSPALLSQIRSALEGMPTSNNSPSGPYGILRHDLWNEVPLFADLIFSRLASDAVRNALALPELRFFQDNLIWKPPGTQGRIEWHQDYSYWPLSGPEGATLWIAIDDVDAENGCLRYAPTTHLRGEKRPADFFLEAGQPVQSELDPIEIDDEEPSIVDVELRAGEAVIHHPLLWHMSRPNVSTRQRRAWSLTFVAPTVLWNPEHAPHPFNFSLNPKPGEALDDDRFPRFT